MADQPMGRLLIVDDEVELMRTLSEMLEAHGYEVVGVSTAQQALGALQASAFDLMLTDVMMPDLDGIALLRAALELDPHLVGVMMTGQGKVQTAVEAMKAGAFDYLLKPFKLSAILPVLSRAIDVRRLRLDNVQLRESLAMYEFSQGLAFAKDDKTILDLAAQAALRQCQADEVSILLPAPDGDALYVAVAHGPGRDRLVGTRVPIEEGIAGWVARHRESLTLEGPVDDPRFSPRRPRADIQQAVSLPMVVGRQLVGVLNVNNTRRRLLSPGQIKALSILVNIAAPALEAARLHERLRASEAMHRLMLESVDEVIYQVQVADEPLPSPVAFVSPQVEGLLGYAPEEFVSDPDLWVRVIHPDDRPAVAAWTKAIFDSGTAGTREYRRRHKATGDYRWFEDRVMPQFDPAGQLVGFFGAARDVTDRKQTEAALRRREAILEATSFAAGHFISRADWQTGLADSLRRLGQAAQVSRAYVFENHRAPDGTRLISQRHEWAEAGIESQLGNPDLQNLPWAESGFDRWAEVLAQDEVLAGDVASFPASEQAILSAQGILSLVVVPIFAGDVWWGFMGFDACLETRNWHRAEVDALRTAARTLGAAIQRQSAEAAMRETEARYQALFEQSVEAVYLFDPEAGRVVDANRAFCRLLRYTPQAVADLSLFNFVVDERANIEATMRRILDEGAVTIGQRQWRRSDGHLVEVYVSAASIQLGGRTIVSVIAQDITERRQHERELEAIASVGAALRAANSRAEMSPIILDQLMALLQADGAALVLRDALNGEVAIELGRGHFAGVTGRRLPADGSLSGKVISSGQPFVTDDLRREPGVALTDLLDRLRAAACVPLVTRERSIGAVWVSLPVAIREADVRVLTAVADLAASAIQRATLHEQTERRLARLNALRTIDMTITASLELGLTLSVLLEQAVAQLRVDSAAVLLLNQPQNTLEFAAERGFRGSAVRQTRIRLGEGLPGQVALERRTLAVPDLQASDSFVRKDALAVEEFVSYCATPLIAKGNVRGVLEVFHRAPLSPDPEWLDFYETLAGQAAIAVDDAQLFEGLQRSNIELMLAYDATIEGWSRALDLRDKETEGHTQRVTELTERLARAAGLSDAELVHVRRGALLHDIGKMGVPDGVLLKPGPLDEAEWVMMRRHPTLAYEMLSPIAFLRPALDIPYCHHEKWDGTGYPRGLKGEQIPLAARLFAVVDVWDALRSDRPYRAAWGEAETLEHLRAGAGSHFDPAAVEQFLTLLRKPPAGG